MPHNVLCLYGMNVLGRGNTCPCIIERVEPESAIQPPNFVGNDYFCDTGSESIFSLYSMMMIHYGMEMVVDRIMIVP